METKKVVILEGNRAREVNPLEIPIDVYYKPEYGMQKHPQECFLEDLYTYEEAENNLREFEIDLSETFKMLKELENKSGLKISHVHVGHDVGSIHNAIVLENGKIRIV